MLSRRAFFRRAAVGAAVLGIPLARAARALGDQTPLPDDKLFGVDPERYWAELRKQWLLAPDRINLNCGSVGCTPMPVLRAVIDHLLAVEAFRDGGYPWFGYEEKTPVRELRDGLAAFLHCGRDELAITRNATEGNNIVCHGLDLGAGDEIVLTDQEHPGGRCCWDLRAKRHGLVLRHVKLPRPPAAVEEVVELFAKALTARTKVLAFSHITSPTGLVLPAKEICALARQRGVLTHIDGAHAIGQIPLDLHDMGCDFYASSPHKWLLAPKGTGILFIREEHLERLWVHTASGDWRNFKLKAYRFSNFGTSNLSIMIGLKAALEFFQTIGPERIYRRIHELAKRVRDRLSERPELRLTNAVAESFYAGLVSFRAEKGDLKAVMENLNKRHIRVAGGADNIRVATHIFTQPSELHAFFEAVEQARQ